VTASSRFLCVLALLSECVGCSESPATPSGPESAKPPSCEPFVLPADCTVPQGAVLYGELRCTGLYGNWEKRTLACGVEPYAPAYELWSDGAVKQRWVSLPAGATVDVTNADDFRYPLGTRFWKEFRVPSPSGPRLGETRLMQKVDGGWMYTTYVWSEDGSNAVQNNEGVASLFGTGHTVPPRTMCKECHAGRADFILGWDALMLSGNGNRAGLDAESLVDRALVTWNGKETGAPNPMNLTIPGDATERAALGYLHANCGVSCHNDTASALARVTGLFLRLDAGTLSTVQTTSVVTTGIGRVPSPNAPIMDLPAPATGAFVDLSPTQPERSLMLARMKVRGTDAQMPRQATNVVDQAGVGLVERFIVAMTPEKGYPAPH
jgi:hypothetical protein